MLAYQLFCFKGKRLENKTINMELDTDRNFVVEFDTWAKQFLDLTFCLHSNASSEYSGQNTWLISFCAISELG